MSFCFLCDAPVKVEADHDPKELVACSRCKIIIAKSVLVNYTSDQIRAFPRTHKCRPNHAVGDRWICPIDGVIMQWNHDTKKWEEGHICTLPPMRNMARGYCDCGKEWQKRNGGVWLIRSRSPL